MAGISMTSIYCSPSIGSWDNEQFGFGHIAGRCGPHVQFVVDVSAYLLKLAPPWCQPTHLGQFSMKKFNLPLSIGWQPLIQGPHVGPEPSLPH